MPYMSLKQTDLPGFSIKELNPTKFASTDSQWSQKVQLKTADNYCKWAAEYARQMYPQDRGGSGLDPRSEIL